MSEPSDNAAEWDEDEDDGGGFHAPCWCDPDPNCWHDTACLDETCGGSMTLHCYCGGDLCVCHNHGEMECPGCDDCKPDGDDYDGDD